MQRSATSVDKSNTEPAADPAPRAPSVDPLQARVDAAAFALLREGRNPTVSLVRARMGGGSPNVVAPALQRWRLTFAGQLDENAGSALEVLPPGVLELVQALWSRALFEAHRVRADAHSTADALEQLTNAVDGLRARSIRLEEREATLDAEIRRLKQVRRPLRSRRPKPARATRAKSAKTRPSRSVQPSPTASRADPKSARRGVPRSRRAHPP